MQVNISTCKTRYM